MPEVIDSHWIELAGYTASALVCLAFYMKTMIPLRIHQNPKFGRYLVNLITQRLLDDYARLRDLRLTVGN